MKYVLILSSLFVQVAQADLGQLNLIETLHQQDILADFWYGDDGEDCGAPELRVQTHNMDTNVLTVEIQKTGLAIGCYETGYLCKISYNDHEGFLEFQEINVFKDCNPL